MQVQTKEDDEIWIILSDEDNIRIGDIISIDDIIVQVVDISFVDAPGILEHLLRKSLIPSSRTTEVMQSDVKSVIDTLSDKKVAITKIRGRTIEEDGKKVFRQGLTEFKISRAKSRPMLMNQADLFNSLGLDFSDSSIAETLSIKPVKFDILIRPLGINLITGKKGSGKSYFAKKLLLRLIENNVITIVFDLNAEYVNIWRSSNIQNNDPNPFANNIRILTPRSSTVNAQHIPFNIPLHEIDSDDFAKIVNIDQTLPMYMELVRFWRLQRGQHFDLSDLANWVETNVTNSHAREALLSRVQSAQSLNIFGPSDIIQLVQGFRNSGAAIIIDISRVSKWERQIIVELILRRITRYAGSEDSRPISLFLEEAQLYVNTADRFVDLLTRMRHLGIIPTFITNDPTTLPDEVFSQLDNLIAFSFKNEKELNELSRSGKTDSKTLDVLKNLQTGQCIAVGDITKGFPIFLNVRPQTDVLMGGETRFLI